MKSLLVTALGLFIVPYSLTDHQLSISAQEGDNAVAEVNGALQELQMGLYTSFAAKRLARLGDEAASAIIRSHTLDEMKNEATAVGIAQVINLSFLSPSQIAVESCREPKMSALLLAYLQMSVNTKKAQDAIRAASATLAKQHASGKP